MVACVCVCVCVCVGGGGGGGGGGVSTSAYVWLACGKNRNAVLESLGLNTHTLVYQPIATCMYPISPDSLVAA